MLWLSEIVHLARSVLAPMRSGSCPVAQLLENEIKKRNMAYGQLRKEDGRRANIKNCDVRNEETHQFLLAISRDVDVTNSV